jgi:hypothetical protein
MHRVSAAVAHPSWSTASRLTMLKYFSNPFRSWPPSASPNSLDHVLQGQLQICSVTASMFISELHNHSLQVPLQTCSITASKCISKLHDLGLQIHLQTRSIMASKGISEFKTDIGLQVHLQIRLIMASKCIIKLTRLWPPSTSPSSHNHRLQVHL